MQDLFRKHGHLLHVLHLRLIYQQQYVRPDLPREDLPRPKHTYLCEQNQSVFKLYSCFQTLFSLTFSSKDSVDKNYVSSILANSSVEITVLDKSLYSTRLYYTEFEPDIIYLRVTFNAGQNSSISLNKSTIRVTVPEWTQEGPSYFYQYDRQGYSLNLINQEKPNCKRSTSFYDQSKFK